MEKILSQLLAEERELQFSCFNEHTAFSIGTMLYESAQKENHSIVIDISFGGRQLFYVALPGTTVDNEKWVERKKRVVSRFGHSSYYMGQYLQSIGKTIEEKYYIRESEYAVHGGCFPIILKDSGPLGTITVSGLPQEEDHKLVVRVLRKFLEKI
ncbi:MAG TPA: heme-degrading domain-containing protein [Treponemataceae bacterium]|nr:heme-degrading domain-containing protein [Treponemataceae bacterium]